MSNTVRLTIGFILLTLSALGPLSAQSGKTAVEGTVVDSSSRILAGADVFLRDMDSGLEIHQATDHEGRFRVRRRVRKIPGHCGDVRISKVPLTI